MRGEAVLGPQRRGADATEMGRRDGRLDSFCAGFVIASTQVRMMPNMDGSPFGVVVGVIYFAIIVGPTPAIRGLCQRRRIRSTFGRCPRNRL